MIDRIEPVSVVGLASVVEIAAGDTSTCARLGDGGVRCWGCDFAGQLGDGLVAHSQCDEITMCSTTPVVVAGLDDAVELSLGLNGAGARRADGRVVGWGWNGVGELGDGTQQDRVEPAEALGITDATRIYTGYLRRCAIRAGGELACWGASADLVAPGEPALTATSPGAGITCALWTAEGACRAGVTTSGPSSATGRRRRALRRWRCWGFEGGESQPL
jgi:hypothetical protein